MKKKTIYFHTGNVKTGTSSVQDFCYMNRYRLLSEHDLYYPLTGTKPSRGAVGPISCNHLRLLYRLSVDQDSENFSTSVVRDIAGEPSPTNIWHQLSEEIGAQSCGKVLVSFETALGYPSFYFYSKPYENGRIFQDLRRWFPENEYDIKFIYYVRRMDDLFISICNQKAQERALGEFVRNSGYADSSYHGLWQQFSTQSRGEVHFWRNQASNI